MQDDTHYIVPTTSLPRIHKHDSNLLSSHLILTNILVSKFGTITAPPKRAAPPLSITEQLLRAVLTINLLLQLVYKSLRGWKVLTYMLQPCHAATAIYLYSLYTKDYRRGSQAFHIHSMSLFPLSLSHPFFFDFTYRLDCTTCSSLHSPLQCRTPHSCTSRLKLPTFGSNTTFSLFSPFGFLAYAGRREEKVDKKKRRGGRGMREKEEGKEGRRRECSTLQRPPNLYIHHYVLLVIRLWIISVRGEEKRRRKRGKR